MGPTLSRGAGRHPDALPQRTARVPEAPERPRDRPRDETSRTHWPHPVPAGVGSRASSSRQPTNRIAPRRVLRRGRRNKDTIRPGRRGERARTRTGPSTPGCAALPPPSSTILQPAASAVLRFRRARESPPPERHILLDSNESKLVSLPWPKRYCLTWIEDGYSPMVAKTALVLSAG